MKPEQPLTLEQVVAATEAVIAANPGRKNDVCLHFHPETKQPQCVVGHVLTHLGLTVEDCTYPAGHPPFPDGDTVEQCADMLDQVIPITDDAEEFLTILQDWADQDLNFGKVATEADRRTWAEALEEVRANQ